MKVTIYCDGGSRGNPGLGGIGIVIYRSNQIIKEVSKFVGDRVTNNQAEYLAVIESLKQAAGLEATEIELNIDSELVVKQLKGEYRIKDERLSELAVVVKERLKEFNKVNIRHVFRTKNKVADRLVNEALDRVV